MSATIEDIEVNGGRSIDPADDYLGDNEAPTEEELLAREQARLATIARRLFIEQKMRAEMGAEEVLGMVEAMATRSGITRDAARDFIMDAHSAEIEARLARSGAMMDAHVALDPHGVKLSIDQDRYEAASLANDVEPATTRAGCDPQPNPFDDARALIRERHDGNPAAAIDHLEQALRRDGRSSLRPRGLNDVEWVTELMRRASAVGVDPRAALPLTGQQRIEAFSRAIAAACDEYRCRIIATPVDGHDRDGNTTTVAQLQIQLRD